MIGLMVSLVLLSCVQPNSNMKTVISVNLDDAAPLMDVASSIEGLNLKDSLGKIAVATHRKAIEHAALVALSPGIDRVLVRRLESA